MRCRRPLTCRVAGTWSVALLVTAAALMPSPARADEEIVIELTTVWPAVLQTTAERRVTFVNRAGRMVHVDFAGDGGRHHVYYQVPDQIWAIFHRAGTHAYLVHFPDGTAADLQGVVEIVADPHQRPDPQACVGVTVMGACLER